MRKLLTFAVVTGVLALFTAQSVFAAVTIDKSKVSNGIVVVNMTDVSGKVIKAQVEKGGEKYVYTLIKNPVNLPLQMGSGEYKVTVLESVGGNKYKPLASETVSASSINENELYKASIPIVEYSVSTKAIPAFKSLTEGKTSEADKLSAVYNNVVANYAYDFNKAANVKSDYVPVIDDVYASKKGICYDYAAVFGGALRSQGIPTRLVMGYVPEITEYHAWNEVLVSGKWVVVDTTYDAQVVAAGQKPKMEKDKSKTKVLKTY